MPPGYINLGFQPETALKVQITLAQRIALGYIQTNSIAL
jgi:hypothetical protein